MCWHALAFFVAVAALPATGHAHLRLTAPAARYPDDSLKRGPCGIRDGSRGTNVTVVEAGSTLHVEWDETVNHSSYYRISFDDDGDDDFADPPTETSFYSNPTVLLDDIADPGGHMSADVRLPDIVCDRCTLQVIQVMLGSGIYYQCADLQLVAACSGDAGCAESPSSGGEDALTGSAPSANLDGGGEDTSSSPAPSANLDGGVTTENDRSVQGATPAADTPAGGTTGTMCSARQPRAHASLAALCLPFVATWLGRRRRARC